MTQATAVIIADSISPDGIRLTTFQLRYWRALHSELMTHRVFSRNAGSSRARPSKAIIEQVRTAPWGPIHWGANQPGMQASAQLEEATIQRAKKMWLFGAERAAMTAEALLGINAHKQIVNRLLEPFTYIDVVLTATDFANWFALRDHPDAQPEIQELARLMKAEYETSLPKELSVGEWHLPYIEDADWEAAYDLCKINRLTRDEPSYKEKLEIVRKISVARCARVSYKAFDGTHSPIEKDIELFNQLLVSQPLHASPAEHIASPDVLVDNAWEQQHLHGNFYGWLQYRRMIPGGISDEKSLTGRSEAS